MDSSNESRHYIVTPSLIDWAHTQNIQLSGVIGVEIAINQTRMGPVVRINGWIEL